MCLFLDRFDFLLFGDQLLVIRSSLLVTNLIWVTSAFNSFAVLYSSVCWTWVGRPHSRAWWSCAHCPQLVDRLVDRLLPTSSHCSTPGRCRIPPSASLFNSYSRWSLWSPVKNFVCLHPCEPHSPSALCNGNSSPAVTAWPLAHAPLNGNTWAGLWRTSVTRTLAPDVLRAPFTVDPPLSVCYKGILSQSPTVRITSAQHLSRCTVVFWISSCSVALLSTYWGNYDLLVPICLNTF